MTIRQSLKGYQFGSAGGLTLAQMEALVSHFRSEAGKNTEGLDGRAQMQTKELPGIGRVVIKPYYRGGLLRRINRRTYFGFGSPRGEAEFFRLEFVRRLGVNAPETVAFASRGQLLYQAWLVTRELPDVCSLSSKSLAAPREAAALIPRLAEQISCLIRNGIHHVDLHPGNVLIDAENRVYIIDFDKAKTRREPQARLCRRYCRRWGRAVAKHGLPRELDTCLQKELAGMRLITSVWKP
ncbi:MAG: lipopolysaccharide kinase InaA family protein [Desulfosalsimonadaceae bacterium]